MDFALAHFRFQLAIRHRCHQRSDARQLASHKRKNCCSSYLSLIACHWSLSNEATPGRGCFYFHHRDARHARARFDRSSIAEAGPEFPEQRHDTRGELEWHFSDCIRRDAVSLFTGDRRFVRSIWPTAGPSPFQPWPRSRLHRHGSRPHHWVVVSRSHHLRDYRFQHSHCLRLHRRRNSKRKARRRLWHDWRSVWYRFHAGAGNRWIGGKHESAAGILGGRRFQSDQLALRVSLRPGITRAREAKGILVRPRQSSRLARFTALTSGFVETRYHSISRLRLT